ncbi:transcription factor bHLH51-like [Silene latifolia]|uniref:transcription factor bHLH51-like n=1 Tax=Silene latifolia TaxID=37657 RepID=UPI003D77AEDB
MVKNSTSYSPGLPEEESIAFQMHDISMNSLQFEGCPSAASSSQSHRQAEKRRRDRINGQLARLRKLVPMSDKMDKAALLERVVDQIRDLKTETSEISKYLNIPTDTDDVTIECHTNTNTNTNTNTKQGFPIPTEKDNMDDVVLIKASFCCEDRPDLISDLVRALRGLNLTTIEADIACLGGRIKTVLLLYYNDNGNNGENKEGSVSNVTAIKQSLMAVLTRLVSWSATTSNFRVTSKRQRFFFTS